LADINIGKTSKCQLKLIGNAPKRKRHGNGRGWVRSFGDKIMTLVAVWQHGPGRIHAIADTRFSHERGIATEHGPKLLPIDVVCRKPGPSGFFNAQHFRTEFGFAYSGSTLSALCAHALANTMCSNLVGLGEFEPPSIDDVAVAVADVSLHYMREIGQLSGYGGLFKAIMFGVCPKTNATLAFEMTPKVEPAELTLDLVKHQLTRDNVIVIGDQQQQLYDRIEKIRAEATHEIIDADAPQRALQALIDEGAIESVGGTVQQAWATKNKLELIATARPIKPRHPETRNAGLFLLGFDIMDMQTVGGYRVSLTGR
jgi:hypothetical protein